MRRLKLTVGINTKLNRGHIVHGREALILPCLARSDVDMQATGRQAVTVEDSMSMVHASNGLVTPPSPNLKSEVSIVCGMARATLPGGGIDWDAFEGDYDLIRDKIEAVFPKLFADFNARIRVPGGFHLHNGAAQPGMEHGDRTRELPRLRRRRGRSADCRSGGAATRDNPEPRSVQYDDLWPR